MFVPPEPDPTLQLTIDKIDHTKLNYDDIRWICSSTMKQYHEEFYNLPNFAEYAEEIILKNKSKNIITLPITPRSRPTTPFIPFIPPQSNNKYIELNTVKSLPSKMPFIGYFIN